MGIRALLFALFLLCSPLQAQTRVEMPSPGSAARKAILGALRTPVEADLRQQVQFKVDVLRVQNGWAFVRGVPRRPDGGAIDYANTSYQEARDQGAFDDWFCALLRREGKGWRVVTYSIGATDVVWQPWAEEYKAPRAIFR